MVTEPSVSEVWWITPRFMLRTTRFSPEMTSFETFVNSLSETTSALASECRMILSSSGPEKSGRMGTITMPDTVAAK